MLARFDVRTELLNDRHGPCPGCGGKDRFRFDDRDGEGTFLCSQGGGELLHGDGLGLLMHVKQWEWKRAVEEVGRLLLPDQVRSKGGPRRVLEEGVAPRPRMEAPDKRPKFDLEKLQRFVQGTPVIDREWVKERSRLPVQHVTAVDFLEALYRDNERVLIFTRFYSQGDFLHQVSRGSCRLAEERGVKAVESKLPTTGKEGVWFLTNPVNAKWAVGKPKPVMEWIDGVKTQTGTQTTYTRRSWKTVTSWRYLTIESDDAPEELWLRALVKLNLPIAAIYSSGGKSLHALVRIDAGSKAELDSVRDVLVQVVAPIGGDPANMTSVRLSRLPGCWREGKTDKQGRYHAFPKPQLQELIYLNPDPPMKALLTLKERTRAV